MPKLFLEKGKNLIFLGTNTWTKDANSNPLTFLTLADPVEYVQHRFIINPKDINTNFELNTPVEVHFELGLYKNNTTVRPVAIFEATTTKV